MNIRFRWNYDIFLFLFPPEESPCLHRGSVVGVGASLCLNGVLCVWVAGRGGGRGQPPIVRSLSRQVDRDGNEELNVQEFRSLYEQTHPGLTLTDAQIRDAFEWSDKDADGNLSFAEVMLWLDKEATEETGRVVPVKCARPQSRRPPKALAPAAARPASAQSHGGAGADAAASWGSAPGPGSLADSHTPWLTMLATCGGDGLD